MAFCPARTPVRRVFTGALVAGITSIALLIPLLVMGPANGASDRAWNRLANCESSRRWHIHTGNGYFGGLQFSLSTWRAFGGRKFARFPHKARRVQQVIIAQRVLRHQGWGAWPACSSRLGLGPRERGGIPHSVRRYRHNH